MKLQVDIRGKCCWFWHKWHTDLDTGIYKYQRCLKCSSKRIIGDDGKGYQPFDTDYVNSNIPKVEII